MVAGKDAARPGEGKNSWLTGTAAWMWYTVSEFILGIKPDYDGLRIDPCVPESANDYTVQRRFREANYVINVHPNGAQKGVKQIALDGKPIEGNTIPYTPGDHTVDVTM
jgi:cellobiose phosphorylase